MKKTSFGKGAGITLLFLLMRFIGAAIRFTSLKNPVYKELDE